ncbi:MAG: MarR family transcriptional regulator [Pseudomonadota bacterium]
MDPRTALVLQLNQLSSRSSRSLDHSLSLHGISFTEYRVLHALAGSAQGVLPRSELAERVCLTPSGVTRLLNPMEKIGLVEKHSQPRDARVSLVGIAPAGREIYKDASATLTQRSMDLTHTLGERQVKDLSGLLSALGA